MDGGGSHLLERVHELGVIDDSLRAAEAGEGALALVEGPPGIGKTELLTAAMTRARRRRMPVLSARGGELELTFPYAVVLQLFERAVTSADPAVRERRLSGAAVHARVVVDPRAQSVSPPVDASAVLHALYWLTANLAADRPVVLVLDDLHWSDPVSMSWLVYLARRIEGLPVALIGGARLVELGVDDALLERLRATDGLRRVEPAPLSVSAVGRLACTAFGGPVDNAFSEACYASTGGNPFYVAELLRALRQDRVAGTAADVPAIEGLTPRAVTDATLARLGRSSREARIVAEAAAVLGATAELRWIAAITGLTIDAVAVAADALLTLGLLGSVAPCRFEHPILRSAVESEISPARLGRLHLSAARLLAGAEMAVDTVAAHLMRTPPLGEAWIISALRDAAHYASARGAPAGAVRSPVVVPWRSDLALALAGTDRHREAVELARAELHLADECNVDRARGHALRALGLLERGEAGRERLEAAVQGFARSPARLELGWTHYQLGAALRRANRRREARGPLDRALDIALACGAELLTRRAGEQLQALGARPRSVMLTAAESLTPSELRVCRLATEGLKNTEIAQALFVSLKTVETHLRSAYRKLDIATRADLAQALGAR